MSGHIKNYDLVKQKIEDYYRCRREEYTRLIETTTDESQRRRCIEQLAPPYHGRPRRHTLEYRKAQDLKRLDAADKAGRAVEVRWSVEWSRNNCPTAETWVWSDGGYAETHHNPRTHAGGWGYDKLSTVMSSGCQCPAIDRLVIENDSTWDMYAVEKMLPIPTLSFGGKGESVVHEFFRALGWEYKSVGGKHYNHIEAVRPKEEL